MPLTAIDNPLMASALAPAREPAFESAGRANAPGFAESLIGATRAGEDDDATAADEQQAREAAQQLVASAFLLPLMRELRERPFEAEFLKAGPGRDAFEQKLHTRLADHMVERMELPIVEAVQRFVTQRGPEAPVRFDSDSTLNRVDRHG